MNKSLLFCFFSFCFLSIQNAIKYEFSFFNYFLCALNLFLSLVYFGKLKNVFENIASFFFFLYLFCSTTVYSSFQLFGDKYSFEDYTSLSLFANYIYFVFFFVSIICLYIRGENTNIAIPILKPYSRFSVNVIVLFAFLLSLISYILGIGKMGVEGVQLPFKLSGIIMVTRLTIIPYLFLLVVIRNSDDKKIKRYFIYFFLWGIVECFVMLSKARLISVFFPIILYYMLTLKKVNFSLVKKIFPVILVFFMLYPIIGVMRSLQSNSIVSSFREAAGEAYDENSNIPFWLAPYKRVFMMGPYYMNALPYIENSKLFDYSKTVEIALWGGSAVYTTYVIDGYPLTAIHSSGTTGLLDALLVGGYGWCYLMVLLLVLFATYIDSNSLKTNFPLKILLFMIFFSLITTKTISYFLDGLLVPFMVGNIITAYLIMRSYKGKLYHAA